MDKTTPNRVAESCSLPMASRATADSGVDDAPVTLIEPKRGWMAINFRELWDYYELLYFLVWRDIKVRYKQTVLGAAWAVIQPLLSMAIFSIIFGHFAKIPSDGVPYPIFVYAGLLPWTFFANAVGSSSVSVIGQANIIKKIYFPRLYIPIASIGVGLVDFAVSFLVYVGIMLWYMHLPGLSVLLLPVLLLLTVMLAAGVGLLLASVTVVYRDFRHVIPFMMQAWMYATPVVYPVAILPEKYRWVMALNPMAGVIGGFRSSLLDQPIDWLSLGISGVIATGLFAFGLYNFRRAERRFADIV
jgi:lipopolysaccharide transport system permease protein